MGIVRVRCMSVCTHARACVWLLLLFLPDGYLFLLDWFSACRVDAIAGHSVQLCDAATVPRCKWVCKIHQPRPVSTIGHLNSAACTYRPMHMILCWRVKTASCCLVHCMYMMLCCGVKTASCCLVHCMNIRDTVLRGKNGIMLSSTLHGYDTVLWGKNGIICCIAPWTDMILCYWVKTAPCCVVLWMDWMLCCLVDNYNTVFSVRLNIQ